ncbi:MAG: hypothetical protein QXK33_02855 [Candidatus Bathyarchaeia archaeon]
MDFTINEETIRKKLETYGILDIKSTSHGEDRVYVAHLLPLPLLAQNIVTITIGAQRFKISSGIIFDSRDVCEDITSEAEKIMRMVTEKAGVTLRKSAEIYWIEMEGQNIAKFETFVEKIMNAIMELNELFSKNDRVREECLYKKYSTFFSLA